MAKVKTSSALTRREILRRLRQNRDILNQYHVRKIGLFGSYASGRQAGKSDIDFVVEFDQPTYGNFMAVYDFLEKLFGRKIDLLTPEAIETIRVKSVAESIKKSLVYA